MSKALHQKPRMLGNKRTRLAIVASKYNERYTNALVDAVIDELGEYLPQARVDLVRVPGAFEIPVTVKALINLEQPTVVIALGVIIEGETAHADLVARSVTDALQKIAVQSRTPIIHEVLLCSTEEQAAQRCLNEDMNRGIEAARAAAAMVDVFSEIDRNGNLRMLPTNV
ncbi:MAG: 6,7-dimethyl-8-ribityllumazine synthase [Verrucomicrobia bacterium]|nr:6,7-dimethyl-8-ribityllumazine synthase [Verrucomicrobiota bacterium]MDA1006118.1 6,7-dimethyl-8-ribityllumazine synthase [Verrucomicrobiota bacterium]